MKKDAYISYQSRLEAIIDATNAATWEWNVQTGEIIVNSRWAEMLGYQLHELEPLSIQTWINLVHPDDLQQSNQIFEKYFADTVNRYDCIVRMRHKKGHWVIIQDSGKIVTRNGDERPEWLAGTHIDVTARFNAELILNKLSKRIPCVIFSMHIDNSGQLTLPFVSEQITAFYQTPVENLQQTPEDALSIIHQQDLFSFLRSLKYSQKQQQPWMVDFRLNSTETQRWLQIHAILEVSEKGITWYGVAHDINRQKMLERQLTEQAELDELTQLPNRRILLARLSELIKLSSRRQQHTAVVVIDLDKFKFVNDVYGHITGDKVLIQFAHILKNRLRQSDVVGRFGGEEFLVLMPETEPQTAFKICNELLDEWRSRKFISDCGQTFKSSFSVGITEILSTDEDFNAVISRADDAMYQAKAAGRSQIKII
ncbi:MAG: diguanylate cyclase [Methylophaga sp.]|nr:diguanylate cyclase [Methylophaga sp.]